MFGKNNFSSNIPEVGMNNLINMKNMDTNVERFCQRFGMDISMGDY